MDFLRLSDLKPGTKIKGNKTGRIYTVKGPETWPMVTGDILLIVEGETHICPTCERELDGPKIIVSEGRNTVFTHESNNGALYTLIGEEK